MTKKLTPELIERHRLVYEATADEIYTCWTCGKELRGNEFYFTKHSGTGRGHKCKYCVSKKLDDLFKNNIEIRRRQYKKVKAKGKLSGRRKAKYLIDKRIEQGILVRPDKCEYCGKQCTPEAHHPNGYDTPEKALDIKWVCRECHSSIHQEDRKRWAKDAVNRLSEEYKSRNTPTSASRGR